MKSLNLLSAIAIALSALPALAYQTCTTSNPDAESAKVYLNVEGDAGQVEAAVISTDSRSYNFYPQGRYFVLDKDASQSPGFSTVEISGDALKVLQVSDTGQREWIVYSCQ